MKKSVRSSQTGKRHARGSSPKKSGTTARGLAPTEQDDPGRKWAWHRRTLMALRDRLCDERRMLVREAREETPTYSMSMADAATDEMDRNIVLSELSAEQDTLYEIEAALRRIRDNTYGICEISGESIGHSRLRAVPWTRFTREVEARLEQEGGVKKACLGTVGSVRRESVVNLEGSELEEERREAEPQDEMLREHGGGAPLKTY